MVSPGDLPSYVCAMRPSLVGCLLCALIGCSGRDKPPPYASAGYRAGTGGSGFQVTSEDQCGPAVSDAGLCGDEVLPTQQDRPNLYFIIDASGSMADPFDGTQNKYDAAVAAIVGVLELIGHRVSYGAARFPLTTAAIVACQGARYSTLNRETPSPVPSTARWEMF